MEALTDKALGFLQEYWTKQHTVVKEQWNIDLQDGLFYRNKAQTDLFWLCNILGYKDLRGKRVWNEIEIDTHQEICDFFVKKDPSFKTFKEFAESVKETHDRLLLVPRGGFKSTIHIADLVQWIVCFPDITALILTGKYSLASDFVGELSRHFTLSEDGSPLVMLDQRISLFQVLFPEHCIDPANAKLNEFTTNARRANIKEPTVSAAGIEQNLSGLHFDLLDLDDVVTNENSLTQTRLQAVNKQVNVNKALMNPYGFFTKIGTWYDVADTYGVDIKQEAELAADGQEPSIKMLIRAALWLKPEAVAKGLTDDTAKEEDYVLWFPERLSYSFLMTQKRKDQESYAIKYLNNPLLAHQVKFPRELMISRTVDAPPDALMGTIFEAWDLGYSEKHNAKYTVGMAGLFTAYGIYIVDMERGRFGEYELPEIMATFAHKWKPRRVAVEDSMGAKWLKRGIDETLSRLRTNVPFEFISLGQGKKSKSKEVKAKGASNLLGSGQLFFCKTIAGLADIYNELEAFPKGTYTDIVCSLSLLVNHFGNIPNAALYQPITVSERMEKLRHQLIYGLGPFAPKVQDATMIAMSGGIQELDVDPLQQAGVY